MFFSTDKPYKGTRPADLEADESSDSAGFADLLSHARLMAWLCLIGFVGFAVWVLTQ